MRCDEVIRELAAPIPDRDRTAIAEHLAACPACAGWASRADQLDRLWEATRPVEPSPQAWAAVWSNLTQALPSRATRTSMAPPPGLEHSRNGSPSQLVAHAAPRRAAAGTHTWRWAALALVGLAQAAAILIAAGLAWSVPSSSRITQTPQTAQAQNPAPDRISPGVPAPSVAIEVDIEEGHLVVLRTEGPVDLTPQEIAYGVDTWYMMFNMAETIALPRVASR